MLSGSWVCSLFLGGQGALAPLKPRSVTGLQALPWEPHRERCLLPFKFTRQKNPVCCKHWIQLTGEGQTVKPSKKQIPVINLSMVKISWHPEPGPNGWSTQAFLWKSRERLKIAKQSWDWILKIYLGFSLSREEHFKYQWNLYKNNQIDEF